MSRLSTGVSLSCKINAKHCISSIPQELYIIKTESCISSSRQNIHTCGVMIYTACAAMKYNALCASMICQALSAWIKKEQLYSCSFLVRVRGRIFALQICPARRQNGRAVFPPAHRPPAKYAKGHVSLNGERLLKVQVLCLFHTKKESISLLFLIKSSPREIKHKKTRALTRNCVSRLSTGAGKRTHICFANLPCSAAKRTSRFPACAPSACEICQRACFA